SDPGAVLGRHPAEPTKTLFHPGHGSGAQATHGTLQSASGPGAQLFLIGSGRGTFVVGVPGAFVFGVHLSRLASPLVRGGVPLLCFTLHRAPGRPRKGALAIPSRVTAHSGFGARDTHPRFFCGVSTNALA